jgi:hypothetical protein
MIELGREMCVNDEHFQKQQIPSEVMEMGISIDSILKS